MKDSEKRMACLKKHFSKKIMQMFSEGVPDNYLGEKEISKAVNKSFDALSGKERPQLGHVTTSGCRLPFFISKVALQAQVILIIMNVFSFLMYSVLMGACKYSITGRIRAEKNNFCIYGCRQNGRRRDK